MQHTLIPFKARQKLHREYYLRALTVLFCLLSVALLVGAAAIFPSYLRSWLAYRAAESTINEAKNASAEPGVEEARRALLRDNGIITKLDENLSSTQFSGIIRSIIGVKGHVRVNSLVVNRDAAKNISISLNGVAPTRDELINFRSRLETLTGTKIEIPIDQLAKSSNLPFSITFNYKMP